MTIALIAHDSKKELMAQFFNPNYALRHISTTFTATISNGAEYQNPGY